MSTNSLVSTMLAGAHNENGLLMLATFPGDHPAVGEGSGKKAR